MKRNSVRNLLFICIQYLLPKASLSYCFGRLAACQVVWIKNLFIKGWIAYYKISLKEAEYESIDQYIHFNDFFTRKLKKNTRVLPQDNKIIVSPADGQLSQWGTITNGSLIQAKGFDFSSETLLGCSQKMASRFEKGSFLTVYLAPNDYHRVHMPCSARLKAIDYIPGRLFSVNLVTAAHIPNLFSNNERLICWFDTEAGLMAMVLVGAMLVASLNTVWTGTLTRANQRIYWDVEALESKHSLNLTRGDEMGFFQLGSTVIVCFEANNVEFLKGLEKNSMTRMGQPLGQWVR